MTAPLVLFDADVLGRQRTGDERYTLGLLRELPAAAGDLRLAASVRNPHDVPGDVPRSVTRLRLPSSSPYIRIPLAVPRLARRSGADLLHVQYFVAPRLPCPAVVTVHDLSFARAPELLTPRDRMLFQTFVPGSLRRARRILAVSEFTRHDLCQTYDVDPDRVVAVPNGVGPRFRPLPDAPAQVERALGLTGPYVLFVGSLSPRKNAGTLLEAHARLVASGMPHTLVLAGGDRGSASELQARVEALGLAGRVRFTGHVSDDLLPALYGAADVLCLPSLYEGFGLPALESMACGTPVAASATTGLGEAVGDAGLTFDPRSPVEVERALRAILEDRALRERLVAAGRRRAAALTWRRAAEGTAAVYRAAL